MFDESKLPTPDEAIAAVVDEARKERDAANIKFIAIVTILNDDRETSHYAGFADSAEIVGLIERFKFSYLLNVIKQAEEDGRMTSFRRSVAMPEPVQ